MLMLKKLGHESKYKERFVWFDAERQLVHWAKSELASAKNFFRRQRSRSSTAAAESSRSFFRRVRRNSGIPIFVGGPFVLHQVDRTPAVRARSTRSLPPKEPQAQNVKASAGTRLANICACRRQKKKRAHNARAVGWS